MTTKQLADKLWKAAADAANKVRPDYVTAPSWDFTEPHKQAWLAAARYVLRNFDKKTDARKQQHMK